MERIEWQDQVAKYSDDETDAEIKRGITAGGRAIFRLEWDDQMVNEWREDFPTLNLARRRLADLIAALTREDKGFSESYDNFIAAELGWRDAWSFRQRTYIEAMDARGFEARVIDLGGGNLCVETAPIQSGVVAWADDAEGYARVGLYPAHMIADGEPHALINWHGSEKLTAEHANQVADLLVVCREVFIRDGSAAAAF